MAQLTVTIKANDQISSVLKKVQNSTRQTQSALEGLSSSGSGISGASSSLQALNSTGTKTKGVFSKLAGVAKGALAVLGGFTMVKGIFSGIASNMGDALNRLDTFDVFQRKMELITNDANQAKFALEDMTDATTGTAYRLDTAAMAVQNFVTRGMQTQDATKSVRIWMDAVSAYGNGTSEQFESVIDAVAKMRTKGTVEMRYLNTLFRAGINPVQMYAKVVGQSTEEVQDALTHKDITAEQFLGVVETAMREGTNGVVQIDGMAKEVASTWQATLTNSRLAIVRGVADMADAVNESFKSINADGLKGIILSSGKQIEQYMKKFSETIKKVLPPILEKLGKLFTFVSENIKPLATVFGTLTAVVGGFAVFEAASEHLDTFTTAWGKLKGKLEATNVTKVAEVVEETVPEMTQALSTVPTGVAQLALPSPQQQLALPEPKQKLALPAATMPLALPPGKELPEIIELPESQLYPDVIDLPSAQQQLALPPAVEKMTSKKSVDLDLPSVIRLPSEMNPVSSEVIELPSELKPLEDLSAFDELKTQKRQTSGIVESLGDMSELAALKAQLDTIEELKTDVNAPKVDSKYIPEISNLTYSADEVLATQQLASTAWSNAKKPKKVPDLPDYTPFLDNPEALLAYNVSNAWASAKKPFPENPKPKDIPIPKQKTPIKERVSNITNPKGLKSSQLIKESVEQSKNKGFLDMMVNGTDNFLQAGGAAFAGMGNLATAMLPETVTTGTVNGVVAMKDGVLGALSTMGSGLSQSFTAMTTQFASFGATIMQTITTYLGQGTVDLFTSFFANLARVSLSFIGAVPQILTGVVAFSAIFGLLGKLNSTGEMANKVSEYFTNLVTGVTTLKDKGVEAIHNFVAGFIAEQPTLVQRGVELVNTFLMGLATAIPDVVTAGAELLITFVTGIFEMLPTLVSTGFQAIQGFIQGIGSALGTLSTKGWEMAITIGQSIAANLPVIFEKGTEVIRNLVQGIKDTLPVLAQTAWNLVTTVVNNFITYFPQFIQTGGQIVSSIVSGLAQFLPELLMAGVDLIVWLASTIIAHLPDIIAAGWNLIKALAQGIWEMLPTILETAGNLMGQIVNKIGEFGSNMWNKALEIGGQLIQGFKEGVNSTWESVKDTCTGWCSGFLDSVKSFFGISSPSTEMIAVGGYVGEGFDNGVQERMGQAVENMRASIDQMIADSKAKVDTMSSEIQDRYADLEAHLNSQLDSMTSSMNDRWTSLTNQSINIMSQFNDKLVGTLNEVLNASSSIWTNIGNDMNQIINNMSSQASGTVTKMIDSIKTIMNEMPSYMKSISQDFMKELAAGIESMTQSVVDKTSELVQKMKQIFLEGMGIHSPSKFGIYVADMIGLGLMKMDSDKVSQFYEHVVDLMQASFDNKKFNADELVNFLSEEETMTLIGKLSGVDTSSLSEQQIAYPLIGTMGTQTSWFGNRDAPTAGASTNHGGVDLAAPMGTPIAAALGGVVTLAAANDGYGNCVSIDHGNGISTLYGHMSSIGTTEGAQVAKGQQIGAVGSTGISTGAHLHFEVRHNGNKIDPQPYLEGAGLVAGNSLSSVIQMALMKKKGIYAPIGGIGSAAGYNASAGAEQWTGTILQALNMLGQPASLLPNVLATLDAESTGNPNAINDWDSNWYAGTPSKGLMQVIDPTFRQYALPGYNTNIWDPLSNILASLNYQLHNYGGIFAQLSGYSVGTRYVPEDMLAMIHKGEAIIPRSQNPYSQSGGDYLSDIVNNLNISPALGFDLGQVQAYESDGLALDLGAVQASNNSSTNNTDNRNFTLNNSFNVVNEETAKMTANEIDRKLHNLLSQGMAVNRKG